MQAVLSATEEQIKDYRLQPRTTGRKNGYKPLYHFKN
jgi:hypothetical protein